MYERTKGSSIMVARFSGDVELRVSAESNRTYLGESFLHHVRLVSGMSLQGPSSL